MVVKPHDFPQTGEDTLNLLSRNQKETPCLAEGVQLAKAAAAPPPRRRRRRAAAAAASRSVLGLKVICLEDLSLRSFRRRRRGRRRRRRRSQIELDR